jgi:hypothetical protein
MGSQILAPTAVENQASEIPLEPGANTVRKAGDGNNVQIDWGDGKLVPGVSLDSYQTGGSGKTDQHEDRKIETPRDGHTGLSVGKRSILSPRDPQSGLPTGKFELNSTTVLDGQGSHSAGGGGGAGKTESVVGGVGALNKLNEVGALVDYKGNPGSRGPEERKAGDHEIGSATGGAGAGKSPLGLTDNSYQTGGSGKTDNSYQTGGSGNVLNKVDEVGALVDYKGNPGSQGHEERKAGGETSITSATGGAGAGKTEVSSYQSGGHGHIPMERKAGDHDIGSATGGAGAGKSPLLFDPNAFGGGGGAGDNAFGGGGGAGSHEHGAGGGGGAGKTDVLTGQPNFAPANDPSKTGEALFNPNSVNQINTVSPNLTITGAGRGLDAALGRGLVTQSKGEVLPAVRPAGNGVGGVQPKLNITPTMLQGIQLK